GDDSMPGIHRYNVAVHRYGAQLTGSKHVVLQGIEFCFFGESGISLEKGTQDCIIRDNVVHNAPRGIIFYDSLTCDNAILHNEVFERGLVDYTWSQIKSSEYGRQAIDGVAGRGNSFCYNLIHGYFDAIAPALWGNPGQFHLNRDMDIMYNKIYNIGDDAIEVEGGGLNVRVHGNTMRNCFAAISVAPIEHGPTYVTRNDATYNFLMFKLNVGVPSEGYTYCYHNSGYCLTGGKEYGGTAISFASANSIFNDHKYFANNIFISDGFGIRYANDRYWIDYNCYHYIRDEQPVIFQWEVEKDGKWESIEYTSIEEFAGTSGREQHGMLADPMFVSIKGMGALERVPYSMAPFGYYPQVSNMDAGDLHLKKTSPCIDQGLLIPGINDKVSDGKPDMGAFEFGN
ncbi:right-handed parallel beta-helix repeat-containing protein, partial [Bacteroidota bacterium]